MSEDTPTD